MALADKFTLERKKVEIYSDFLNNFDQNPFTGLLSKVTNEESVKQSIRNLILTQLGERFYDSDKGSNITEFLFDLYDPSETDIIKLTIQQTIERYEPRAIVNNIEINDSVDVNSLAVKIVFSIRNIFDENFVLDFTIKRVR